MSAAARAWDRTMLWLREYHSYSVVHGERVPKTGPAVVASTHSLATYENFLLGSAALESIGRRPYILVDDLIKRSPALEKAAREINLVPGKRETALELLARGELLGLGPGGMREALRSSKEKYEFDWRGRLGFVWVSLLSGAPIILAACPGADDIYTVYDAPVTPWAYRKYHLPLPFFRGLGPTLLPRPVKLWHVMSEPIAPSVPPDRVKEEDVVRHHELVVERMRTLMEEARDLSRA